MGSSRSHYSDVVHIDILNWKLIALKVTGTICGQSRGVRVSFVIFFGLMYPYWSQPSLQKGLSHAENAVNFYLLNRGIMKNTPDFLWIMKNTEKMKFSLSQASTAAPIIFIAIKGCTPRPSHLFQPLTCSMKLNLIFLLLNWGITLYMRLLTESLV